MSEIVTYMPRRVAKLEAKHLDKDGNLIKDYGVVSKDPGVPEIISNVLLLLLAVCLLHHSVLLAAGLLVFGIITNVGVIFEANAFAATGPSVAALNYHDSGTGMAPPAITDTALVSPAGAPRVLGLQSVVSTNGYQTTATITYASNLIITEWGLFSSSLGGTLWDRRLIPAITTAPGDKIQFTYSCFFSSGGI